MWCEACAQTNTWPVWVRRHQFFLRGYFTMRRRMHIPSASMAKAGSVRHIVLILALFLMGAALPGSHPSWQSGLHDLPPDSVEALAPDLSLRAASRSEVALDTGAEETPNKISASSAQDVTNKPFLAWLHETVSNYPDANHGNPARAPPPTG